jgi:nucleoid DNA-binding protein
MATITKKELVDGIAERLQINQLDVRRVVEDFIKNIKSQIQAGNRIEIRDFGVFEIKIRKPRIGRNPKKPQDVVTIPERKIVHFKVGREFKKLIVENKQTPQ